VGVTLIISDSLAPRDCYPRTAYFGDDGQMVVVLAPYTYRRMGSIDGNNAGSAEGGHDRQME
jgi:hypothetical protein